ncbi:D-galactoside-specific lectin [Stylophora pistillata]|uniref:D-galactoside-specific lectin n=1 Tax=Stylophora pistillata TaxID=50429 RepID=A0A2B4RYM8_STYPI|nr:D-galactoside-specific lectin [Stylophora pistillata]
MVVFRKKPTMSAVIVIVFMTIAVVHDAESASEFFVETICDGEPARTLRCPKQNVLSTVWASYGRLHNDICIDGEQLINVTCKVDFDTVLATVQETCDDSNTCELESSKDAYGDPPECRGVKKYLQVYYLCKSVRSLFLDVLHHDVLPKLHKPGFPMRPIVSFCGSPTHQLSKYLTTTLQPLTDKSRHKLQSTEDFINATKTVQIPDDYKLVSFDLKSLFTSIPLQLALQCTETAIRQSTDPLPLPTDDIMDLLNICLTSTYFQYNGKHYKQLYGTAMGSPVSVVIAEIVMQNIEERALSTCRQTIPLWLRYVDDTFTAVRHDEIDAFHNHLNEQNTDIQFTREVEENGKLPFLDCLYNGKHYKQLHGTAMGSPVSVVIAEIVMQNIEERALSTCRQTIPLWLRYVDDTFTAVRHDEIDAFHNHLNEQNTDIQFTREVEENGKLPFLDCLVSHNDNSLRTTVYRKPTHTDRLLDESSYNPTSHKATTIRTLTRRAQLVCDSTDSLSDENKYLHRVFTKNNYNNDFIRRNTHRPTTTTETNDTATPTTTATIPYIKGMSENISRILLPFNIRVAHKPITTLRQLLTNVKDKDEPRNRQGTIYKINCSDCQASYIGETGRNLTTRLTEHRRATRKELIKKSICEFNPPENITCPEAQTIEVVNANYGRTDKWTCGEQLADNNRCTSPNSDQIVKEKCNGQNVCELEASNEAFGNPCGQTHKYLQVDYHCQTGKIINKSSGEMSKMMIMMRTLPGEKA